MKYVRKISEELKAEWYNPADPIQTMETELVEAYVTPEWNWYYAQRNEQDLKQMQSRAAGVLTVPAKSHSSRRSFRQWFEDWWCSHASQYARGM